MKISELTIRQSNVDVDGVITEMGEIRTFDRFGRELKVANAVLKDDSGSIKLTLWNDDTNLKEGDKVKVVNGYINEFQGEKQLTAGKFGKIEVVGTSSKEKKDSKAIENDEGFKEDVVEDSENAEENSNEETEEKNSQDF
ncbi:MAG: SOSS complex subunit B family protein [Nanoarchaeota archaeon]